MNKDCIQSGQRLAKSGTKGIKYHRVKPGVPGTDSLMGGTHLFTCQRSGGTILQRKVQLTQNRCFIAQAAHGNSSLT